VHEIWLGREGGAKGQRERNTVMKRLKNVWRKNPENEKEYLHNEDTQVVRGVFGKWGMEIRHNNKIVR